MKLPLNIVILLSMLTLGVNAVSNFHYRVMMDMHREPPLPERRSSRNLQIQFLEQRVDNFNPQNYDTFKMAYFENDEFFAKDGPIFIFIGGEWAIDPLFLMGGHMYDMAAEFNATMFYTEHRYYGRSFPTNDLSTENLRFLTVEQALADLAHFIVQVKRQQLRYANSDVILVGGSYSASMATWFRQFYPHLAVGAWASSAPVLAKLDFAEYKEIVGASFGSVGGRPCYARLENAFAAAEALIAEGRMEEFRELFGMCEDFGSHPLDVANVFSSISTLLAIDVQYHMNGRIEQVCANLLQNLTSPSSDLSELVRYIRQEYGVTDDVCVPNFEDTMDLFRNTSNEEFIGPAGRQWLYQTCTEFGWWQTSTSDYQPFGSSFPMDLYYGFCSSMFGEQFNAQTMRGAIDRTNVVFGGFDLNVKNVYFTNGLLDPWRAISVQEDLNESSPADVIPGASHSMDLLSISPSDTVKMRQVKDRITRLVREWLRL